LRDSERTPRSFRSTILEGLNVFSGIFEDVPVPARGLENHSQNFYVSINSIRREFPRQLVPEAYNIDPAHVGNISLGAFPQGFHETFTGLPIRYKGGRCSFWFLRPQPDLHILPHGYHGHGLAVCFPNDVGEGCTDMLCALFPLCRGLP